MGTEGFTAPSAEWRFYTVKKIDSISVILVDGSVTAGFPSPADDYLEARIDLKRELVRNPDATFVVRVQGDSMTGDGISDGDVLVVDRSLKYRNGSIAVCCLNNAFTVKKLEMKGPRIRLVASNPLYPAIDIQENDELLIWGVVTYIIKKT